MDLIKTEIEWYMQNSRTRTTFVFHISILCALLLLLIFVSMCVGRYSISVKTVIGFFFNQAVDEVSKRVILYLRIPRTLVAILVGAALSVSGAIYQSTFNNKLVSPDLLGVSSGASVGACLAILLGLSAVFVTIYAFVFGFFSVFLTVTIAKAFKNKSNVILLLCGLATGGLMSSLVGLLKYLADDERKLAEMTFWLLGDLSATTINNFYLMLPVCASCFILVCVLAWQLNILSLGKKEAVSLGVSYSLIMGIMIFTATALTATSVSVAGNISWIGLVIPNIVRIVIGSDNKKVIPLSMLYGAIMLLVVDKLARTLAPNEIPLSVITGILGSPFFVFAIFMKRKEIQ